MKVWSQSDIEVWPPKIDYQSRVKVYDCYNPKIRDTYQRVLK